MTPYAQSTNKVFQEALDWYTAHPGEMIPNIDRYKDHFDRETWFSFYTRPAESYEDRNDVLTATDMSSNFAPFLAGLALNMNPEQLLEILQHHEVRDQDVGHSRWYSDTLISENVRLDEFDVLSAYVSALEQSENPFDRLGNLRQTSLGWNWPSSGRLNIIFNETEYPEFWYANAPKAFVSLTAASGFKALEDFDFSRHLKKQTYMDFTQRCGLLQEENLKKLPEGKVTLWDFMIGQLSKGTQEAILAFRDEVLQNFNGNSALQRLVRGTNSFATFQQFSLSYMLENAPGGFAIGLGTQVIRTLNAIASWKINKSVGYDGFGDSARTILGERSLILTRLTGEILNIPVSEIGLADLEAFRRLNDLNIAHTPLASGDAERLLHHLFETNRLLQPQADAQALSRLIGAATSLVVRSSTLDDHFLKELNSDDQYIMGKAGVAPARLRNLTLNKLGGLFSNDLNI